MGSGEAPSAGGAGLREGGRFLLILASFVVVVAGLSAARSFLVPLLLAAFIAFLCWPAIRRLKSWGVPSGLAVAIVVVGLILLLFLVSGSVGNSISEFSANVDTYGARLDEILHSTVAWLEDHGAKVSEEQLREALDSRKILELVATLLGGLLGALSDFILILLTTVFMLIEAEGLPAKLRRMGGDLSEYRAVTKAINDFLKVQTIVSLITGSTLALFLAVVGVDYPLLWGLLACLFNYIPNIGSFIAAIPPILLALITKDPATVLVVAAGYVVVNMVVGNVLQPRMMGKKLGLSVFVTVLSLVFWNWVLGPVGMLLSIPLTMIVKILLENSEDLKPIAILLGPADEA